VTRAFATGVVAGYGIAIPVGAIAILIIETGIRGGFRPAFLAGAGAATADAIYAAVAVLGGAAVVGVVDEIGEPLRIASGLLLIVIAGLGLWRAGRTAEGRLVESVQLGRTYARFLGLTLVNPATVVYFAAIVIGLGVTESMTGGEGALFVIGAGLASLSWQTLIAYSGAFAGGRLSAGARKAVTVAGNLVVLGFALVILFG
jgi:threonine/homoserine/homoserine lactone efflux protein